MLEPYRILDLTDHRGELGPMILADLGADVIRVEPPDGSEARRRGPMTDAGASLQFAVFNRNKRSVVLDLTSEVGRAGLLEFVAGADIVFESAPPGLLRANGITFDDLRAVNPRIVQVLITPFGADGPAAERPANDLTLSAMGGQAALQGLPERAPLRVSAPQVFRHTGAEAAPAAMIGLTRMAAYGRSPVCGSVSTMQRHLDDHERHGCCRSSGVRLRTDGLDRAARNGAGRPGVSLRRRASRGCAVACRASVIAWTHADLQTPLTDFLKANKIL